MCGTTVYSCDRLWVSHFWGSTNISVNVHIWWCLCACDKSVNFWWGHMVLSDPRRTVQVISLNVSFRNTFSCTPRLGQVYLNVSDYIFNGGSPVLGVRVGM
jgi:hypothetical protein